MSNARFPISNQPTLVDVQSRATELNPPDKDIPEADQLLFDESRRLNDEIRDYRSTRRSNDGKQDLDKIDSLRKELVTAIENTAKQDCTKTTSKQLTDLTAPFKNVTNYITRNFIQFDDRLNSNIWDQAPWRNKEAIKYDMTYCDSLKTFIGDANSQQAFISYMNELSESLSKTLKSSEEYNKAVDGLLDLLQKRKSAVQAKINAKSTQQQIGDSLWLVILLLEVSVWELFSL